MHTGNMCLDAFSVEKSFAYIFAMAKGAGTLLVSNKNRASLLSAALACGRSSHWARRDAKEVIRRKNLAPVIMSRFT